MNSNLPAVERTQNALRTTLLTLFFILAMILAFGIIRKAFYPLEFFAPSMLIQWDAEHYMFIRDNGYEGFRVAFFPLFPWLMKLLPKEPTWAFLMNLSLLMSGLFLLAGSLKISLRIVLAFVSIPLSVFFLLPYSESTFFFAAALLIVGLVRENSPMVAFALFIATLARPSYAILLPALLLADFYCFGFKRVTLLRSVTRIFIVLLATMIVAVVQWESTGQWFEFFSVQSDWGNQLQIPGFPFSSWSGVFMTIVDAVAFIIGMISGLWLVYLIWKRLNGTRPSEPSWVIASLAFLGGITLSVLLFRGGVMFSLSRFVFATPFLIVIMNHIHKKQFSLRPMQWITLFLIVNLTFLMFGSYVHILTILKFASAAIWIMAILLFLSNSTGVVISNFIFLSLLLFNIVLWIVFANRYVMGMWIG